MGSRMYSRSAIALHWLIALMLAFQLGLGWRLEDLPRGPVGFAAFQLHKSVGITILLLTLLRIAIRLTRPRPQPFADSGWARAAASAVHFAFYAILILVPISGWVLVSTAKVQFPTLLFGMIPWPHLPVPHALHEPAEGMHGALSLLGVALFLAHVAGALRHQFIKDENILGRMMPLLASGPRAPRAKAASFALLAIGLIVGVTFAARQLYSADQPAPATGREVTAPAQPLPAVAAPIEARNATASEPINADETEEQPLADWKIARGGSLGFVAQWNGTPVEGNFGSWTAAIRFSPDALDSSTIDATVDLASVTTQDSQRDDMLKGGDFFDVAAHPRARFSARGMRALGGNRYGADGTLQLHGVTRPLSLRFTLDVQGDRASVNGSASLDRTRFGVGKGDWAATDQIAGAVAVTFAFTANRLSN